VRERRALTAGEEVCHVNGFVSWLAKESVSLTLNVTSIIYTMQSKSKEIYDEDVTRALERICQR